MEQKVTESKSRWAGFWSELKSYFNVADELEAQDITLASVRAGVSFKGSQLLVLIFAIFIASLGLNTNSIPVIIGAMLISPLMGPIIGMGVAIGIADYSLLRVGLKNITMAVIGSLLASAIYFLISPQYGGNVQLLARTSPSIYDVFVGLFGGAAGIVSIACKNKGQVMPGVAIATSLMPPLCTAGYGLATLQMSFFLGALYLFFINMIFILFASWIGVKLMGYKRVVYQDVKRYRKVQLVVYSLVAVTVAFSVYLTVGMLGKTIFVSKAADFVENDMVFPNTQVLNHSEYIKDGKKYINVTLIGEALPKDSLQLAMMNKLDSVGLGGTVLNITQGFAMSAGGINKDTDLDKYYNLVQHQLTVKDNTIDSLRNVISLHNEFSEQSVKISPEVKVIFPTVYDIALSRMIASSTENAVADTLNMVFVHAAADFKEPQRKKLLDYLKVRLGVDTLFVTVNPSGFPWPAAKKATHKP